MANLQPAAWENFYVIVGSSGGAMIGLQFIVITLIAEMRKRTSIDSIRAFGTSTIMHLGGAFLVSAIMSAPWPSIYTLSIALSICGLTGLSYGMIATHRAGRQQDYHPVWEDWLWFFILPTSIYVVLFIAALLLHTTAPLALYLIAAAALGLLFVGIRNAWDTVTYLVIEGSHGESKKKD